MDFIAPRPSQPKRSTGEIKNIDIKIANMPTREIKQTKNGEQYIEFTDEELKELGWVEGDTLEWINNQNGSFTLKKKSLTEFVLVETVLSYRMRYCVEVPKDRPEFALDIVAAQEAKEFSQKYLGEHISSHRVIKKDKALKICRKDNDYVSSWDDQLVMDTFFHKEGDTVEK